MKKTAQSKTLKTFFLLLLLATTLTAVLFYLSFKKTNQNLSLVGIWQDSPTMAAGWANRYHFFADGRFSFVVSQMDCSTRLRQIDGTWTNDNGQLKLTKQRILTWEDGEYQEATGSCGTPQELVNYQIKVSSYSQSFTSENEQYGISIQSYNDEHYGQSRLKTDFGNNHYFKFYDDPQIDAPARI